MFEAIRRLYNATVSELNKYLGNTPEVKPDSELEELTASLNEVDNLTIIIDTTQNPPTPEDSGIYVLGGADMRVNQKGISASELGTLSSNLPQESQEYDFENKLYNDESVRDRVAVGLDNIVYSTDPRARGSSDDSRTFDSERDKTRKAEDQDVLEGYEEANSDYMESGVLDSNGQPKPPQEEDLIVILLQEGDPNPN